MLAPETAATALCLPPIPQQGSRAGLDLAAAGGVGSLPVPSQSGRMSALCAFIHLHGQELHFQQQPKPRLKSQSKAQAGVPGWVERWGVGWGRAEQAASRCRGPPRIHTRSGASEGEVWWRGGDGGGMASQPDRRKRRKSRQPLEARKEECWDLSRLGFAGMERRLGAQGRLGAELLPHSGHSVHK